MKNWNETLKCALDNVDIEDENTVTFYLPEGQCVDMTGAIKIATMLSSGVKTINTHSGKEADTRYVRKGKEWQALMYAST
jgi:hypothetical protein